MKKGTIKRPAGAREPMIRLTGDANLHIVGDSEASIEDPSVPQDWGDILHGMFRECKDSPWRESGCNLLPNTGSRKKRQIDFV